LQPKPTGILQKATSVITFSEHLPLQAIAHPYLTVNDVRLQVLRTDVLHPVVSGNKWFKLHLHLQAAQAQQATCMMSFGGAYSNHLVAMAYACNQAKMPCVGIIRGEAAPTLSHTLTTCRQLGMELVFVSRTAFRQKETLMQQYHRSGAYWVPEGGGGRQGIEGATVINTYIPAAATHIVVAAGTGTTAAGIALGKQSHQQVLAVSVTKGYELIHEDVQQHIPEQLLAIEWLHAYHFGGYAKPQQQLFDTMNRVYNQYQVPLDWVYTVKAWLAIEDLAKQQFFPSGSNVVLVHTGGLQGNLSLPQGTLSFPC